MRVTMLPLIARRCCRARVRARVAVLAAGLLTALGCGDPVASDAGGLRVSRTFGEIGTAPGHFNYPRAMDATADGRLVVVDKNARIQIFDPADGTLLGGFRTPDWSQGKPSGLTIAQHPADPSKQAIWVADTHYHRVLVYALDAASGDPEASPEPILSFGSYGRDPGHLIYTTDVAVAPAPAGAPAGALDVFVSEYGGNDRVTRFRVHNGAAEPVLTFGRFGYAHEDDLVFHRPQSLLWDDARQELIVADSGNHRVGRFTRDGELLGWMGSPDTAGDGAGGFFYPRGLSLFDDGTLLVAEFGGNRLQRVDLHAGASLGVFGEAGRGVGQLASPWAAVLIGDDPSEVAVLDSGNNRVHVVGVRSVLRPRAIAFEGPAPAGGGG